MNPEPGMTPRTDGTTRSVPRLTIGLPVYNGERFLAASLDALLAQTFTDYELIICDNASTDGTERIARDYAARDPRVRYVRHDHNLGAARNHNIPVELGRGELFKWASDDDLYAPDLLRRCVDALDARPEVVLAHSATAFIDEDGEITNAESYPLQTDSGDVTTRFRSLLYTQGGDDIYGVIRMSVMRAVQPHGSFHNADRTVVADLALHGRFHQVDEALYFRRDHPGRAERAASGLRRRTAHLDPSRANRWAHPAARLVVEYLASYAKAVASAPISRGDRRRCLAVLAVWILRHANPLRRRQLLDSPDPAVRAIGARSGAVRMRRLVRLLPLGSSRLERRR
jgi:glycosyltransferase involved in cell wall biosynthesis